MKSIRKKSTTLASLIDGKVLKKIGGGKGGVQNFY